MIKDVKKRKITFLSNDKNRMDCNLTIPFEWINQIKIDNNEFRIIIQFKDKIIELKNNDLDNFKENTQNIRYNKLRFNRVNNLFNLALPITWVREMNITKAFPFVLLELEKEKILIKKFNEREYKSLINNLNLYTVTDVSDMLGISRSVIYRTYLDELYKRNYVNEKDKIYITSAGIKYIKRNMKRK